MENTTFPTRKIEKNGVTLIIGYGILTKNPTIVTKQDIKFHRKLTYILYEGWWYTTKFESISDVETYLQTHLTYSKEQLFDLIYKIVY